ncbi:PEP-CTERM sorting domain-containing protein [Coleofasciculus sp.]|uniref:PEP-CTERM sorting domain-containing protein n=1 Tax=Coleofasciculus sp. TaxID=3100458 RepID=UPI0039F9F319
MSNSNTPLLATKLISLTAALGLIVTTGEAAKAATLRALNEGDILNVSAECLNDGGALVIEENPKDDYDWQNSEDSPNDGVDGDIIGGKDNRYELYGMSVKETVDSIFVVLNGNMPLTGVEGTGADDRNTGWGDLFINLTDQDFTTASEVGDLFAVRFSPNSDSGAPKVGLYANVTAKSVTKENNGFGSLEAYNNAVVTRNCIPGLCEPSFGDLPATTTYFDQGQSLNSIASGEFIADIIYLSDSDLITAGYDLDKFDGNYNIGFKFDKSGICERDYCESVPEPSTVFGLATVGLIFSSQIRKRRRM